MIGILSIIRRKVIGKLASYVTADGQSTEMQMNLFLNGMPILHLIPQKKHYLNTGVTVLQTSGSLTSLHMTSGYAAFAESQSHNQTVGTYDRNYCHRVFRMGLTDGTILMQEVYSQ